MFSIEIGRILKEMGDAMPENFEVGFYEFIHNELSSLESRIDRRFAEFETRTDRRFDEQKAQMNEQFKELKDEVRWPRRIAIAGVITTVMAVGFAIIGFKS
ncbi:hypothetical protein AGMMS49944_22910 [Spirochaetia bacterium]|nr:hypothetical protein AGMMS49944_22910 [Spirochaetia bacterium]